VARRLDTLRPVFRQTAPLLPHVALSLGLVVLTLAAPARADEKSPPDERQATFVGAVARQSATPGIAERVEGALARAFERGGTRIVTGAPAPRDVARGKAEDLARLLADARGRFFDGDFKGAVTQCDDAIARFESTFAYTDDDAAWRAYADLMVVRVLALQRLEKTDAADRALSALAAQRPDFVPDPGLAPPKVIERHRDLLGKLQSGKHGTIVVESKPAGAAVLLDGRSVGVTPLKIESALAGPHYVAVTLGQERVDTYVVLKNGTKNVAATFKSVDLERASALRDAAQKGGSASAMGPLAASLAEVVLLAVVEARAGTVSVLVGRFEDGNLKGVTVLDTSDDLRTLDDDAALLADAALWTEGERGADGKTIANARARFLGIPIADDARAKTVADGDESEGSNVGLIAGIGGAALVGVIIVVGGVTTAVVMYLLRPPNPGGTDVIVDTSRL